MDRIRHVNGQTARGGRGRPLTHRKVLIVDDSAACRVVQASMARALGAETTTADTAVQALALAGAERFDLIILDIGLADADGRVLISTLREAPNHSDVRILCVSGLGGAERSASALESGADAFSEKPFDSVAAFGEAALLALAGGGVATGMTEGAAAPLSTEVAACALEDLDRGGQRLHDAVARGDFPAVRRAAHFLSGVAGILRDSPLSEASRAVESASGDSGGLRAIEDMLCRVADAARRLKAPAGVAE